jgi:hypothetical protein
MLGVVPLLGSADGVALAGAILAASDRERMIQQFDEDWFDNPEAARALRDEDARVPAPPTAGELEAGLAALGRAAGECSD